MASESDLIGNWGEQFIAEKLSVNKCLIRHVPQGHDSGIDLYCETTSDGRPFLHFWCQVKVRSEFDPEVEQVSINIDYEKWKYWIRQPVPVVIALVPNKPGENPPIFICKPSALLKNNKLKSDLKLINPQQWKDFLVNHLPLETFMWDIKLGKVSFLKTPEESYTKFIPSGITSNYEADILQSLRMALVILSTDLLMRHYDINSLTPVKTPLFTSQEAVKASKPYIEALSKLAFGKKIPNYEVYLVLGLKEELDNNLEKAQELYEDALKRVENDTQLDKTIDPWKSIVSIIKNHLMRIKSKK